MPCTREEGWSTGTNGRDRHQWKRATKHKSEVHENGYNKGSKVGGRDRQKSGRDQVTTKQQENQGQAALLAGGVGRRPRISQKEGH